MDELCHPMMKLTTFISIDKASSNQILLFEKYEDHVKFISEVEHIELSDECHELISKDEKLTELYWNFFESKHYYLFGQYGNMTGLKILKNIGYTYPNIMMFAARNGDIKTVWWLFVNGFHKNEYVFAYAAWSGNIILLDALLRYKFPYDVYTFCYGVKSDKIEVVKWLKDKMFPFEKSLLYHYLNEENVEMKGFIDKI